MTFKQLWPTVSLVLGDANAALLDQHAADLVGKPDEDSGAHFKGCPLASWCSLNRDGFRDRLELIEWSLEKIVGSPKIDEPKLRNAFSKKAKNSDQFDQLLGELATAATVAKRAVLLDLEWKTGKQDYDADVRAEISRQPVNLEVTLRTDSWLDEIRVHAEDLFDEHGNQIAETPVAKSRRTLTDRQWDDLHETGFTLPKRVSEVVEERKRNSPKTVFVSDPNDLPEDEAEPKAYCADGDNPRVESRNLQRCIQDKAQKFNGDGIHLVVLATMHPGFPSVNSVFDALFGQAPQLRHHGIFEGGLYDEICGVIYLPVNEHLEHLRSDAAAFDIERHGAVLFPNHNAKVSVSEKLMTAIADVFQAGVRRGWICK